MKEKGRKDLDKKGTESAKGGSQRGGNILGTIVKANGAHVKEIQKEGVRYLNKGHHI